MINNCYELMCLLQAAYALPRWLKPETSTNRVWLRQGHLHIVPPPSLKQPQLPVSPSVEDALKILSSGNIKTHNTRQVVFVILQLLLVFGCVGFNLMQ